jgi:ketosteroid isomerase-like protein
MDSPDSSTSQDITAVKQSITELEDSWVQGVINRDAAAFDRLLAPDFVYTEDDRVYDKAQLIAEVTTGPDSVTSGRNEDMAIRVHGETVVVTGWLILAGSGADGPFERHYRYTDIWQKSGESWQVIAAQDYLKP